MTEQVEMEMPRYVSHKEVWALELSSIGEYDVRRDGRLLEFVGCKYEPIVAGEDMFKRYVPVPGDFYVIYADGYKSFSPRKAFLDGYKQL